MKPMLRLVKRLGLGQLIDGLKDLAFAYFYPNEYDHITKIAGRRLIKAKKVTKKSLQLIKDHLHAHGFEGEIHGRHKRKYSLYKKLTRPEINGDITKIYDLVALRIITNTKKDCYTALGLVHELWSPVPHIGTSDFISRPKANGYRSIHTKVFDHRKHILEIQIRTREMHEQAEFGQASHVFYGHAKSKGATDISLEKGIAFKIKPR